MNNTMTFRLTDGEMQEIFTVDQVISQAEHIADTIRKQSPALANKLVSVAIPLLAIPMPVLAEGAGSSDDAWKTILETVLLMADWLVIGVIIFAGTTWMFGNRTKAIENLIGGSIGYVIIRHAEDIQQWLALL